MSQIPKSREIYRHFKGSLYQVLELAEHSETGEQLVIYQALYGDFKIYARPLQSFMEKLDAEKYPDAAQTFRFELQTEEAGAPQKDTSKEEVPQKDVSKEEVPQKDAGNAQEEIPEVPKGENDDAGAQEYQLDPQVLEFLDADSYEQKLNILVGLRHRITDEMITTMAIACDVEVLEGSLEERFLSLKNCLLTKEKYECERPR